MKYKSVKLTNNDGKMWHIGLDENDIGKHLILPGDPARCEMVNKFFENGKLVQVSRGNPTYTGTYKGIPVSVMSTGMGPMAVAVCVEELKHIGAKTLIRMGTSGSLQPNIPDGSFVIATGAVRGDMASRQYIDLAYPAIADIDVVNALRQACQEYGVKPYCGVIRSHDAFYLESPGAHGGPEGVRERIDKWTDAGVLSIENESSALFTVSSLLGGLRAGTILLTGGYLGNSYGAMSTSNDSEYPKRVELMTKITLRAIEIIDGLEELVDVRE
ncbi:MAG TPA: nucleoside phosphorylase [Erysipelotrichaceae bacterium]|jgi:uridine phosphorylase|nr:nucleoside phosphorylase [Erysipelotrichaceae bacterium]HQA85696.1 nucleoside phosphorylase [Erysipelotrichaceae bacterium]